MLGKVRCGNAATADVVTIHPMGFPMRRISKLSHRLLGGKFVASHQWLSGKGGEKLGRPFDCSGC